MPLQDRSPGPPMDEDTTPKVIHDDEAITARVIDDLDKIAQIMMTGWMPPLNQ